MGLRGREMWTDTDTGNLFRALGQANASLDALVKQGEGILRLAEEVERLKAAVKKLEE